MANVEIRPATDRDLEVMHRLLSEMHGKPAWRTDDTERAAAAWQLILAEQHRHVLIADVDGVPVGTVDLVIVPNLSRGVAPWAGVENLVVTEQLRGRGVGRALLDAAISKARESGCYKVQLVSAAKRGNAHRLYDAAGFSAPVNGYRRYLIDI